MLQLIKIMTRLRLVKDTKTHNHMEATMEEYRNTGSECLGDDLTGDGFTARDRT
jgi:hypothetical protein